MLGSGLWGVCTLVSRYFCISGIVIIIILCIGLVVHVCVRVRAQLLSCVQLLVVPWTVAHQAPLSVGFSRQEYWCELSFPTSGDLPDPMSLVSRALVDGFCTTTPPGKPCHCLDPLFLLGVQSGDVLSLSFIHC